MLQIMNKEQTMSSVDLVVLINKVRQEEKPGCAELAHNDFLKKIREVLGEIDEGKFSSIYKDSMNRTKACYLLPRRECNLMVMSESYKVQAAVYDKMEKQASFTMPSTLSEALLLASQLEAAKEAALAKIEADKPAVEFAKIVSDSSNTRCIRVWVKSMKHENNLTVGEKEVFKWLVDNKYIYRDGKSYLPYSRHESNGTNYFTIVIDEINGHPIRQIKITGKGVTNLTSKVVNSLSPKQTELLVFSLENSNV